ncbi:hypothetical protein KVH22_25145 [Streptomyces olivaceus]|uniref:hypothetical protein n=1 Tax=Streptomyces olivaceus TaxID=47716 RepID=UPI001CCD293F|nr:hypothetical protein [Streptomyces olivaceus]MBZ6258804.1 hypothetical protein [Streptomyces olivaceus]
MSTAEIITRLQAAWKEPGAGESQFRSVNPAFRPIAGSDQDQTVPSGMSNPMWEAVRWMPAEPYWHGATALRPTFPFDAFSRETALDLERVGASRDNLAKCYAWSIISPGDVTWMTTILEGRAVVEVGAGTGYWAWQLEQAGVDVAAYDPHEVSDGNKFCTGGPYTTVLRDDAAAVRHHQDRALLMVWPPYGGEHARHALSLYEGDLFFYAGESAGGCTADDGFYELLDAEWDEVSVAPQHVTWWGVHCQLAAYRRKGGAA